MNSNGLMDTSPHRAVTALPPNWSWERFKVLDLGLPKKGNPLKPLIGHVVAIHCQKHNRYVRMNNRGDMDVSPRRGYGSIPGGWAWERFLVVDAGRGEVAFHSASHNRFIRLRNNADMDGSGRRAANHLPGGWTWERYKPVDAGGGYIAFHSRVHHRFMRMNRNNRMDGSGRRAANALPGGWTWERFRILDLGRPQKNPLRRLIGHMVAIHSPKHNKYV